MAVEKVREFFKNQGIEDRITEFDESSATVELAAAAIGCEPERIAKSITFKVNDEAVLIVASGDAKIDNPKYKAQFGTKAKMLSYDEVEQYIGHAVGGVCPFAVKDGVKVYLDVTLKRFDYVYPAAGSSNSVLRLSIDELEKYSASLGWIDVCKTV